MADTLDASIEKMKTLQTETKRVEDSFVELRKKVQGFDTELLKSIKVTNQLKESFKGMADNIYDARQQMHDLQNRVFKTTTMLKDMDSELGRVGLGLEQNTTETQQVIVESSNYTEVLEKMADSLAKMEHRQKQMRIATNKYRKEQKEAAKATEEVVEAAHEYQVVIDTLGLKLKSATHGTYEMNRELSDGTVLVNAYGQEVNNLGEVITDFNKRSTLVTKTINKMNKESKSGKFKSFEIFSREVFEEYQAQGGNIFEFLAEGLSGTREEITLLGVEGAKARKILYGFFPPGAFRVINKASSLFQLTGGFIRKMGVGSEEAAKRIEKLREQKAKMIAEGVPRDDPEIEKINEAVQKISEAEQGTGSGSLMKTVGKAFNKLKSFDILGESVKGVQDLIKGPPPQSKVYSGTLSGVTGAPVGATRFDMIKEQIKVSSKILGAPLIALHKLQKAMSAFRKKNMKNIMPILKMAGKFFMSAVLYLVLIFMLVTLLKKPIIKAFGFLMTAYKTALVPMLDGVKNIFRGFVDLYEAFRDGDIFKLFEGLGLILYGIVEIGIGLVMAWFATVPALALGFLAGIGDFIIDQAEKYFKAYRDAGIAGLMKAATFVIAAITVFFIGLPAILAIAVAGLIYGLAKAISDNFEGLLGFRANGGQVNTPITVVGERGPEILVGAQGSNVISNERSRSMVGNSVVNNFSITINAKDTSKAEMRRIADEIGKQINQKMNRKRGASIV